MLGLKRFETAAVTIRGIELAEKIKKQQFNLKLLDGSPTHGGGDGAGHGGGFGFGHAGIGNPGHNALSTRSSHSQDTSHKGGNHHGRSFSSHSSLDALFGATSHGSLFEGTPDGAG